MTHPTSQAFLRLSSLGAALGAAAILCACVVQPLPAPRYYPPPPRPVAVYEQPAPAPVQDDAVVSVYVDPPLVQPEPIAVQWAPPPMLVEVPPPQPYAEAIWTGGYWAWEGRWFWSAGRWAPPPRPDYGWVQPYYEHRGDVVVFVPGFWCAPQARFVPPPVGLSITVAVAAPGVRFGARAMGPQGVFVPPPPGSRAGIIVPAPLGTPPAVVVSAPAVVNVGMRVHGNVDINSHNTVNNVTNITNVTNVTIEAPANATANGQAFQNSVPARAHLAAGLAPAGRPAAPQPVSQQAIPTYQSGRPPMALPAGQPVRNDRFGGQNGARPGAPQPPLQQQSPALQGQGQQPPHPGQAPGQGQNREFDPPPRTPAAINGQQPQYPGQQAGGQPGQPGQQWQQRPGNGQPPQGQAQGQAQQPTPQGLPQQVNPQDPRRRGGNPQGQPPGAQPGAQAASQGQQPPQAKGKDGKEPKEKDERKKTGNEREREKKDGERER